jgi:hypothetical protein
MPGNVMLYLENWNVKDHLGGLRLSGRGDIGPVVVYTGGAVGRGTSLQAGSSSEAKGFDSRWGHRDF